MQILLLHNLTYTWEKIKRALHVIATFSHFFFFNEGKQCDKRFLHPFLDSSGNLVNVVLSPTSAISNTFSPFLGCRKD